MSDPLLKAAAKRWKRPLPAWLHGERLVEILGALASGVGAAAGSAHVAWYWLLAMGVLLTAILSRATAAILEKESEKKYRPLTHALVLALALPLSVVAYHFWLDPSRADMPPRIYHFVIDGTDPVMIFYPSGEPGVQGQVGSAAPVIAGSTEDFTCQVTLPDGTHWLQMAHRIPVAWIPVTVVHPVAGLHQPQPPDC